MSVFVTDLGIACPIGVGKDLVTKALFKEQTRPFESSWPLISGKNPPVGAIQQELPRLPGEFDELNSRNNRLLRLALDEVRTTVYAAISKYGASRVGVVMATSTSGMFEEERAFILKEKIGEQPEFYDYAQTELSSPSIFAARYFHIEGPAYTVSTACSAAGKAMASAYRLIKAGICDVVITGGVDTLCDLTLNGFDTLELISQTHCNPFSKNRDGITIGEGAAVFVLSKETTFPDAIQLTGYGESSDAFHISCPEPNGLGAEVAMKEALEMAGLEPADICYINLHGTGTLMNDAMESRCINRLFGENTPCSSTKGMTGHLLGASGAIEAGFVWLALQQEANGRVPIPGQVWDGEYDPEFPKINIAKFGDTVAPIKSTYAMMSNSFAFGGSNVSLIFTKSPRITASVVDLLPHDPPMVLLDQMVSYTSNSIHTQVAINDDSPFCENGRVPSYVSIEYMAQTVGVWNGSMARINNTPPKLGFLLGARKLDLKVPDFKVGQVLDVFGTVQYLDGEMASFNCWIEINNERVVEACLNVFQPKDLSMFGDNNDDSK